MSHGSAPKPPPTRSPRAAGFTFIEVSIMTALLVLIVGGVTSSFWTMQTAFNEQVASAELQMKSRGAMDRLVRLAGTALSTDPEFGLTDKTQETGLTKVVNASKQLVDATVTLSTSSSLEFREIQGIANGQPVYDDELKYMLLGPESAVPVTGVIVGRGPDVASVYQAAAGADGILGTADDELAEFVSGTPAVEVLLPGDFAPSTGEMLEFRTVDGTGGNLVTITLRVNLQRPDGSWLLPEDMVLQERVALRW